jgi:WD40 repeat protein
MEVKKIATLTGHNASVFKVIEGKTPQHLLSADGAGWIVEWDLADPEIGRLIAKAEGNIFALAFLKEKNILLAGTMYGGVHWLNLNDTSLNKSIAQHEKGVFGIEIVENDVFTIGGEGTITRWSSATQRTVESHQLSQQPLRAIAYSAVRDELAIASSDRTIYFLDRKLNLKRKIHQAHHHSVFSVCYSPDGKLLWSGGRDAHLNIWNIENDEIQLVSSQPAHFFTINAIAYSLDQTYVITGSRDKTIKIWDAATFELLKVVDTLRNGGHINSVNSLLASPYNNYIVSGSDDRRVMVWEAYLSPSKGGQG